MRQRFANSGAFCCKTRASNAGGGNTNINAGYLSPENQPPLGPGSIIGGMSTKNPPGITLSTGVVLQTDINASAMTAFT